MSRSSCEFELIIAESAELFNNKLGHAGQKIRGLTGWDRILVWLYIRQNVGKIFHDFRLGYVELGQNVFLNAGHVFIIGSSIN